MIQVKNAELIFISAIGDREYEIEIEDGVITSPANMTATLHTEFMQNLTEGNIEIY